MKSLLKIFGLLSLIAILLVGCDSPLGKTDNPEDETITYRSVEDVRAVSTSEKAVLSWIKPDKDWFGIRIDISPKVSDWNSEKIFKDETSILVENLSAETEYTFTFTTLDKAGKDTDKTALLKIKTPAVSESVVDETAPANVTNLVATNVDGGILLTWTDATDEDIFGYEITYSEVTATRAVLPMEEGSIFVAQGAEKYLMAGLGLVIEYNFAIKTMDVSGNKSSGVSVTKQFMPNNYEPFSNLTETTAHPMKYVVDFADLIDFVKGKDDNVSEDGTFTIANNEQYGDLNETDRQSAINVEGMFKNNLPKMGDVIELHGKFTSDIDIDNMIFMIVDNSPAADYWGRIVKDTKESPVIVSKDKTNDFTFELPVLNDCLKSIAFVIAYGKHNGNGELAKLKFTHCAETNVKTMDAPASIAKNIEVVPDANFSGIKLKVNMDVPATAVRAELTVVSGSSGIASYMQRISKDAKTIEIPAVTAGDMYYVRLQYFDADSKSIRDGLAMIRTKAESGIGFENADLPLTNISDNTYKGLKLKLNDELPDTAVEGTLIVYDMGGNEGFRIIGIPLDRKELYIPYVTKGERYMVELSYRTESWGTAYKTVSIITAKSGIGFAKVTNTPKFTNTNGLIEYTVHPEYSFDEPDSFHYEGSIRGKSWEYYTWYGQYEPTLQPIDIPTLLKEDKKKPIGEIYFTLEFCWILPDDPNEYRIFIHRDQQDLFLIDWDAVTE